IQVKSIDKNHHTVTQTNRSNMPKIDKSILMNPNKLENMIVEDIEQLPEKNHDIIQTEQQTKSITIITPTIKNNNNNNNDNHINSRLTAPINSDYCIRMPNTSTMYRQQQQIELKETRSSDALGYLRMY
ncbi:unnamed protein product, partial [Rotaria socialis]